MANLDQARFVERLRFFDGQRLAAADLQDVEAFQREMRELHNRSLHQPGIGNGFAVSGQRGDRQVTIGPGYALDAAGHEIILTTSRVEPVPPVDGDDDGSSAFYDLTVSYPRDADLEEAQTREGICLPRGVVRLREEPVFCWVRLERTGGGDLRARDPKLGADIQAGWKLVLARAEVHHCQLQSLTISQRRSARPAQQPYIACGSVLPDWKVEEAGPPDGDFPPFFLTGKVSTAEAGFVTTPCYWARLDGPRELVMTSGPVPVEGGGLISAAILLLADGLVGVEEAQPDGFTVRVLPITDPQVEGKTLRDAVAELWRVVWMGIE